MFIYFPRCWQRHGNSVSDVLFLCVVQAATKYHPDKVKGSEQDKAAGAEKFKEIGEAYGEQGLQ